MGLGIGLGSGVEIKGKGVVVDIFHWFGAGALSGSVTVNFGTIMTGCIVLSFQSAETQRKIKSGEELVGIRFEQPM